MGCHGGFFLEESVRRKWYNPEALLNNVGLRSGMVFVDVGCGDGFFTLLAAKAVGETGKVYATDVDASAIEKVKHKVTEQSLKNVQTTAGEAEKTVFCNQCADIVFYSMVLHDFKNPAQVLLNAKQMLKPTGALVDLDWKKQPMPFGPPPHIRFSEAKATDLLKQAGFTVKSVKEAGAYHYIITANP